MTDHIEREKNLPTEKPKIETTLTVMGGLVPTDFDSLYRFCNVLAASGLMPKGLEKVEAVFVAVQMGLEVGLSPMQAVQNIAPINGRPAIWGDAVLGLVRASGLLQDFSESMEGTYPNDDFRAICKGKRKGEKEPFVREFSIADAKQAGLWCQGTNNANLKYTPWYKYPKRMLQMRARSWALRDGFGDVLKGLRVAEEVLDYDIDMARTSSGAYSVSNADTSDLSKKIKESQKEDIPKYGTKEYARKMVEGSEKEPVRVDKPGAFHQESEETQPTKIDEPEPTEPENTETVEENQKEPEQQKTEEVKTESSGNIQEVLNEEKTGESELEKSEDERWADFYDEWKNKRSAGFSTYFYENRTSFESAPLEIQRKAETKWHECYPKTPFPIKLKPADDEEEKAQMIKAISDFFEPSDVTQALHQHNQTTLTACDMVTLRTISKYLRENADMAEELA